MREKPPAIMCQQDPAPDPDKPKVSVCILSYNYAPYIEECLKSTLEQATSFPFEVIIGDDNSQDGTRDIIRKYLDLYPQRLKAIFHPANIGGCANYLAVHEAARGDYIAHLDGDDYMLPGKLEAQAAFLDSHPDYNIVKHRMMNLAADGDRFEDGMEKFLSNHQSFTVRNILRTGTIGAHSSKMYRNGRNAGHIEWPPVFLDWYTDVIDLADRKLYVMKECLGVYRLGVGMTSRKSYAVREILIRDALRASRTNRAYKHYASGLLFRLFLGDLIRRKPTLGLSFRAALQTFTYRTPYHFIQSAITSRQLKTKFRR